ncbi:MAG: hypothetical protein ABI761_20130 [Saprospiraceae bacterium]
MTPEFGLRPEVGMMDWIRNVFTNITKIHHLFFNRNHLLLLFFTSCSKSIDFRFIQRIGAFCLFMFICTSCLMGQESYIKGRIILMNQDTLRGYFFQPSLDEQRSNILFKRTLKGTNKSISKKQIKSLHSDIVNYESYEYSNRKLITLHALTSNQKDSIITFRDTFFLEVIVEGGITLYRRHESQEPERFFVAEHGELKELMGNKLTIDGYRSNDQYKLQLHDYLVSCKEKSFDSKKINFREKNLADIIIHENECRRDLHFIKKLGTKWRWQAITGYTTTLMRFYNRDIDNWRDFNWKSSNFPVLGVSITPLQYNKPNRYLLVTEAFFQHQNSKTQIRYTENFNDANGLVNFETFNLKINLLGQIYLRNQSTKAYVIGGVSNSFPLSILTNDIKVEAKDALGSPTVKNEPAIGPEFLRRYDAFFLMGGGIEYRKFSLEFRMDFSDGLTRNLSVINSHRNLYLLFKYSL